MGFASSPFSNVVLKSLYNLFVWRHRYTAVSLRSPFFLTQKLSSASVIIKIKYKTTFQQPNQTNQLNIARYKKAVSTAIYYIAGRATQLNSVHVSVLKIPIVHSDGVRKSLRQDFFFFSREWPLSARGKYYISRQ